MSRPTVHDIAREAGVSLATVDRVLNARPGVRDTTIARVQDAVARLGYIRDLTAANLARQRQYRFAILLPDGPGQFVPTLRAAIAEAALAHHADRVTVTVIDAPARDPHALAAILGGLGPARFDGVAIMAAETPPLRDAIARLKDRGLAVVALVSDLPSAPRDHFVGIDNIAAGRTAGTLMGRFLGPPRGPVLAVTDTLLSRDALERRLGFDAVMARDFPTLPLLPSVEFHGDRQRLTAILAAAWQSHPAIAGIYSMSADTDALLDALAQVRPARPVVIIAHELTPSARTALLSGAVDAVITQNTGHLVRSALRVLRAKSDGAMIFEAQETIRIEIVLKENLP